MASQKTNAHKRTEAYNIALQMPCLALFGFVVIKHLIAEVILGLELLFSLQLFLLFSHALQEL